MSLKTRLYDISYAGKIAQMRGKLPPSLQVTLNRPLTAAEKVTCFPRGIASILAARLGQLLFNLPRIQPALQEVAVASVPVGSRGLAPEPLPSQQLLGSNIVFCAAGREEGGSAAAVLSQRMEKLLKLLESNQQRVWSSEDLQGLYASRFSEALGQADFNAAVTALVRELKAKDVDGCFQYYDQVKEIDAASRRLVEKLEGVASLGDALRIIGREIGELFTDVNLYLYNGGTKYCVKALKVENGEATLQLDENWEKIDGKKTLRWLITKRLSFLFFEDVLSLNPRQNPISQKAQRVFRERYKNPAELRFGVLSFPIPGGESEIMGFMRTHQWKKKEEEGLNRPHYSLNNSRSEVDKALGRLQLDIAAALHRILRGRSMGEVWNGEAAELKRL